MGVRIGVWKGVMWVCSWYRFVAGVFCLSFYGAGEWLWNWFIRWSLPGKF